MKKILLSAMALVAAMSVNAQTEIAAMNDEAAAAIFVGDPNTPNKADATENTNWLLDEGLEILKTDNVSCTLLYANEYGYGKTGLSSNNVKVNGEDFGSTTGIQGSKNGPGTAASEGTFPTEGCIYHFVANTDGYLYVIHKASANKNYVVFEEKTRIPYIFATANGSYDLATIEGATVTDGEGITTIAPDYAIGQAQAIIGEDGKGAGTCVIKFPVYEGLAYDVLATGSKMTMAGFVFDTTGDATISLAGEDAETVILDKGQIPGAPVVEEKVYSIIGTLVGNWDVDTDLTKNESGLEGLYETVFENVAAGSYEVKFRQDHDWKVNWGVGGAQDGDNIKVEVEKDGSMVVVLFDPATGEYSINVVAPGEPAGDILSLIDKFVGVWGGDAESVTANEDGTITYVAKQWGGLSAWLAGDAPADYSAYDNIVFEFAEPTTCAVQGFVQYGDNTDNKTWIEAGATKAVCALGEGKAAINQIALQAADVATFTITRIYLEKADASAINAVKAAAQDSDAIYNIAGQKVSASYKGLVIKNGKKYIQK